MRDPVFAGLDEAGAVAEAARTLDVPAESLRYVVLDGGTPAGRGVPATPTRIAVIVGSANRPPSGPAPAAVEPLPTTPVAPQDARPALRGLIEALAVAADGEIEVEAEDGPRGLLLSLKGAGTRILLHDNGEALEALSLLLQRVAANLDPAQRVEVRCEAVRQRRDQHLRDEAMAVARAVAGDRRPRPMPALNAYDRRIVHMAVAEVPGVASRSQGEGRERRVVVLPQEDPHA